MPNRATRRAKPRVPSYLKPPEPPKPPQPKQPSANVPQAARPVRNSSSVSALRSPKVVVPAAAVGASAAGYSIHRARRRETASKAMFENNPFGAVSKARAPRGEFFSAPSIRRKRPKLPSTEGVIGRYRNSKIPDGAKKGSSLKPAKTPRQSEQDRYLNNTGGWDPAAGTRWTGPRRG